MEKYINLKQLGHRHYISLFFFVDFHQLVASGIYQNSVYGMAAKLPSKYIGAVVLGSNISGTFTSIIAILSLFLASSPRTAAIYYFIGAMFVLLACFDTYFALPLNVCHRSSSRTHTHTKIA